MEGSHSSLRDTCSGRNCCGGGKNDEDDDDEAEDDDDVDDGINDDDDDDDRGTNVLLPTHLPANFFEIRIGAHRNVLARYERNVVPSGQSVSVPSSKLRMSMYANRSSSIGHLPVCTCPSLGSQ